MKNHNSSQLKQFTDAMREANKLWQDASKPRLTLAWGDCDYFHQKACLAFRGRFQAQDGVFYNSFDASELSSEQFMDLTQSSGMFDPTSAYCIRRVDKTKDFLKFISEIPHAQAIQNHLILSVEAAKPSVKFLDECKRLEAVMIPCFEISQPEAYSYAAMLCRKFSLKLSQGAQKFLLDCVGDDLFRLENEIQKLSLIFANSPVAAEAQDLAQYLGLLREDHAFKLTNLIMARRSAEAMTLVNDLLERGESSLAILGILARHLRMAIKIAVARQVENRDLEISRKLQIPAFIIKSYNEYVRTANIRNLAHAIALCQKADLSLKTSRHPNESVLLGSVIDALST